MTYEEFLARIIDDGIEAARRDYAKKTRAAHLRGAVAGFEACRGKSPIELKVLLDRACMASHDAHDELVQGRRASPGSTRPANLAGYWEARCYELEVEWVCNCVSAMLYNEGHPVIVPPTARGTIRAAEVLARQSSAVH